MCLTDKGIWPDYIAKLFRTIMITVIVKLGVLYFQTTLSYNRRKFRSQTSDNMDRWKSRGGKSQRRERVRRKKMQVREKVEMCFSNDLWLRRVEK